MKTNTHLHIKPAHNPDREQLKYMQRAVSMSTLYVVYAIYLGADGIKNVIYEIVSATQITFT